jgi:hypothetical protein
MFAAGYLHYDTLRTELAEERDDRMIFYVYFTFKDTHGDGSRWDNRVAHAWFTSRVACEQWSRQTPRSELDTARRLP